MTPFIVENKGQSKSRSSIDALSTVTSKSYQGIVTDEKWDSFLSYNYHGTQTSHIAEAADAFTTKDRHSIVTYQKPKLEDCYYRMLQSAEIQTGMGFEKEYIVLGSGKDQVKQLGNAVTPPVMEMIIDRCIQSLN